MTQTIELDREITGTKPLRGSPRVVPDSCSAHEPMHPGLRRTLIPADLG
jgi:hypothetical protein